MCVYAAKKPSEGCHTESEKDLLPPLRRHRRETKKIGQATTTTMYSRPSRSLPSEGSSPRRRTHVLVDVNLHGIQNNFMCELSSYYSIHRSVSTPTNFNCLFQPITYYVSIQSLDLF